MNIAEGLELLRVLGGIGYIIAVRQEDTLDPPISRNFRTSCGTKRGESISQLPSGRRTK